MAADASRMARIFRALSNPNRLKIYLEILKDQEAKLDTGSGCHLQSIVGGLKIGSPTVSHHVRELVNADLITADREGKFLVCRINPRTRELARGLFEE
jgi:DNA-binding transcriptional ArsR family regulator